MTDEMDYHHAYRHFITLDPDTKKDLVGFNGVISVRRQRPTEEQLKDKDKGIFENIRVHDLVIFASENHDSYVKEMRTCQQQRTEARGQMWKAFGYLRKCVNWIRDVNEHIGNSEITETVDEAEQMMEGNAGKKSKKEGAK